MNKALIVGPSWVGDMVMAQSLFMVLKQTDPAVEITVLAPPWSIPVLARMPEVTDAVEMPLGHGEFGLWVRRKIGHELRRAKFSRAIVLPGSFKSALVPWFAKIPRRTGYLGEQRRGVLNDIRRLDDRLMPRNVQRFVALGLPRSTPLPADLPHPALKVNVACVADTAARFGFNADAREMTIALCPGAEYGPAKQWPAAYFAEVANRQLRLGRRVWLFGSHNDRAVASRINGLCRGRCADLSGRTTLGEAADLMSLAKYTVTNDSGLMHVAAAVGCHVVAVYGSSSDAFTPPLTDHCDRLSLRLACSPCFRRTCPLGHLHCLKGLRPAMVLAALK